MLNGYVQRIVNVLPELLNGNAALARLRLLHDAERRVPYHGTRRIAFRGGVRTLRNVSYSSTRRLARLSGAVPVHPLRHQAAAPRTPSTHGI